MEVDTWIQSGFDDEELKFMSCDYSEQQDDVMNRQDLLRHIMRFKARILLIFVKQTRRQPDHSIMFLDEVKCQWRFNRKEDYTIAPHASLQHVKGQDGFVLLYHGIALTRSLFHSPNITLTFVNRLDMIEICQQLDRLLFPKQHHI
jgi:hypothetical protein